MNLYKILHIREDILLLPSTNIHNNLKDDIASISKIIDYAGKFHSYFHFEQSFAYLLTAFLYKELGEVDKESFYLEKCLFQDHTNQVALDFEQASIQDILSYDRNIKYEDDFLDFALGDHILDESAEKLDLAMSNILQYLKSSTGEYKANRTDILSDSHRFLILLSLESYGRHEIRQSLDYAIKASTNLEESHKNYHEFASSLYEKRAQIFDGQNQPDLAKNDRIKAKDLVG